VDALEAFSQQINECFDRLTKSDLLTNCEEGEAKSVALECCIRW
jgi:hypothetical protein